MSNPEIAVIKSLKDYYNYQVKNINIENTCTNFNFSVDYFTIKLQPTTLTHQQVQNLINGTDYPLPIRIIKPVKTNEYFGKLILGNQDHEVILTKSFANNRYYTGIYLRFNNPKQAVVDYFGATFGGRYRLNRIEYSIDITSDDPWTLYNVLKYSAYGNWAGKLFKSPYDTSEYVTDNRSNRSKFMKFYIPVQRCESSLRMETTLCGGFFNDKKIYRLATALALPAEVVFQYWKFKIFEYKKYLDRIQEKHNDKQIQEIMTDFSKMLTSVAMTSTLTGEGKDTNLTEKEENAKGRGMVAVNREIKEEYSNPQQFFSVHPFQTFFFNSIKGKLFELNG